MRNNTEGSDFLSCPGVRTRALLCKPQGHPSGAPSRIFGDTWRASGDREGGRAG